jgi:pimeloyl-ACP methyl ester carboxylesterase
LIFRRAEGSSAAPAVSEMTLEPGLPTLKIGSGERTLLYLPGLTFDTGLPKGGDRRMAATGWDALLDRYTIYRAGRRPRSGATSFAEMAGDAIAAIDRLGAPVDLMGFSTGGLIAYRVAATRPELIQRLVLVASGTKLSDWGQRAALRAIAQVRAGSWRRAYATILSAGAGSALGAVGLRLLAFVLGPTIFGKPTDPSQLVAELDAWTREDAGELTIPLPTLLVANERDRVFPIAASRALAARLPEGKLAEVRGKGHAFPANAIADHIAPFLG